MARSFEDMEVWQETRKLVTIIYKISGKSGFNRDRSLVDQVRRASISILSNISEGFERGTRKEFQHYLFMSKGSAGELRAQMHIAYDLGYVTEDEFENVKERCRIISSQLARLIQHLQKEVAKGAVRRT